MIIESSLRRNLLNTKQCVFPANNNNNYILIIVKITIAKIITQTKPCHHDDESTHSRN